jgi:transposase
VGRRLPVQERIDAVLGLLLDDVDDVQEHIHQRHDVAEDRDAAQHHRQALQRHVAAAERTQPLVHRLARRGDVFLHDRVQRRHRRLGFAHGRLLALLLRAFCYCHLFYLPLRPVTLFGLIACSSDIGGMEITRAQFEQIEDFLPTQRGNVSLSNLQVLDAIYEGNETRQLALDLSFIPVVPPPAHSRRTVEYDRAMYKRRNEVERLFRRLKGYRRIFSRFEKLDVMFTAFIGFALISDDLRLC